MCKHFRSNFVFKTTFVGTAHVMEGGGRQMGVAAYEEGLGVPLFPLSWLLSLFLAWTSRIQSIATMSTTATTMTTSAVRELRLFSVDPFRNCPPRSLPPPLQKMSAVSRGTLSCCCCQPTPFPALSSLSGLCKIKIRGRSQKCKLIAGLA